MAATTTAAAAAGRAVRAAANGAANRAAVQDFTATGANGVSDRLKEAETRLTFWPLRPRERPRPTTATIRTLKLRYFTIRPLAANLNII